MTKKKYIGEILVENGACTAEQVDEGLEIQQLEGGSRRIGEIMRDKGYINEDDLLEALSIQIGIPYIREIREEMVELMLKFKQYPDSLQRTMAERLYGKHGGNMQAILALHSATRKQIYRDAARKRA